MSEEDNVARYCREQAATAGLYRLQFSRFVDAKTRDEALALAQEQANEEARRSPDAIIEVRVYDAQQCLVGRAVAR